MPVHESVLLAIFDIVNRVREGAYAPYSDYQVGAAVIAGSGHVYYGCNVENASYGLTVCAERVAIFKAVSEGEREIQAVVIMAGETGVPRPCGACLQVMSEFTDDNAQVQILVGSADGTQEFATLHDYMPRPFKLD